MGLRIKRRVQQFRHGVKLLGSFLRTFPKVLKLRKHAHAAGQKFIALSLPDVLGDIVAAEPTVRQVRCKFPNAHIYWIAKSSYVDLMKYHPDLTGVIPVLCFTETYLLKKCRIFDEFHDMFLVGRCCIDCGFVPKRPGPSLQDYFFNHTLGQAAAVAGGLEEFDVTPQLHLPEDLNGVPSKLGLRAPYIVIHGQRVDLAKTWMNEKWTQLVDRLRKHNYEVIEIGAHSIVKGALDLTGKLSLLESAAVIRNSALFIGIDSGPAHVANALNVPGVVLLGDYQHFGKYMPFTGGYRDGTTGTIVRSAGPPSDLEVDEVYAAVLDRLAKSG